MIPMARIVGIVSFGRGMIRGTVHTILTIGSKPELHVSIAA